VKGCIVAKRAAKGAVPAAKSVKRTGGRARAKKRGKGERVAAGKRGAPVAEPKRLMRIRELDPHAACGSGTTVLQLFRVDDLPFDGATTHLVFFDRHGWYCEHGRDCPAVEAVRRHEMRVSLTR
jgi:hypothetical protein